MWLSESETTEHKVERSLEAGLDFQTCRINESSEFTSDEYSASRFLLSKLSERESERMLLVR